MLSKRLEIVDLNALAASIACRRSLSLLYPHQQTAQEGIVHTAHECQIGLLIDTYIEKRLIDVLFSHIRLISQRELDRTRAANEQPLYNITWNVFLALR